MNLAVHSESNDILSFRSYFQSKAGTFFETPGINKDCCMKYSSTINVVFLYE